MTIAQIRQAYHSAIKQKIIRESPPAKAGRSYPNLADGSSRSSIDIAWGIVNRLLTNEAYTSTSFVASQTVGTGFEGLTKDFLESAFSLLQHLRPGRWSYSTTGTRISYFEQYQHLARLTQAIEKDRELASILGGNSDYLIVPDIVVARYPIDDSEIDRETIVLEQGDVLANHTPFRSVNQNPVRPILHASISCKWTIRSDRTQNIRTEALNLIRNRKGSVPHIMAVTAEPLPTRIASIALGTGDLDCVYHFALPELQAAIEDIDNVDQLDMLETLVSGRRLRDISNLPFNLAI